MNPYIRSFAAGFLFLLISVQSFSRSYFVSSSSGNDTNDGSTPAATLRTIAKVNTLALQAGDSVLFMRGDVFSGELAAKSGMAGRPIVYAAYGSGNRPIIDGTVRIASTDWSVYSGSIMMKNNVTMAGMDDAEPPMLFFNGTTLLPARHPNSGFLEAQAVQGVNPGSHCCEFSLSFSDSTLSAVFPRADDLTSALVTAYDPYGVSTRQIRSYDPGSGFITIDTLRGAAFIGHRLYFLSAALPFLDRPGEWYYDAASRRLYAWFPDDAVPAAADTISCSSSTYGINAWQVDDFIVRDLEIRRQKIAGFFCVRSDRVTVENCMIREMKHGIILWGSDGSPEIRNHRVRIVYNEFSGIFRTAINSRNLEECGIIGNSFRNIGMVNALGQSGKADQWKGYGYYEYGLGIQASGINSQIIYNRFFNTGRQALAVGGPGVLVRNNVVDSSCINYNDCGGIMPLGWSRIEDNIIRNSIGPIERYSGTGARGIYPDFRVEDTIRGNTIINTRLGIGLTNSKNEVVSGNTIYGSLDMQFRMNRKNTGPLNNRITGNIFFGLDASQHSVNWDNQITETDDSFLDSNRYWNPYVAFPTVKFKKDSLSAEGWYDLAAWKTTGHDLHSTQEFISYASEYVVSNTIGISLVSNGNFDFGTSGWGYPDSMTIVSGVLDGNCARMKKNSPGHKTLSTILTKPLDTAQIYFVQFTIADPSNIGRVNIRVRQNGGDYISSLDRWYLTKSTRREYWTVFKPVVSGSTRLEFGSSNSTWWIDNVALFAVNARHRDPAEAFPIFVNDGDLPLVISLGERCYLDLDSNLVTESFVLPPFSSRILIALDSCSTTGIVHVEPNRTMRLDAFPNPVCDGRLTILSAPAPAADAVLMLFDALGRKVWERSSFTQYTSFQVEGLHSGKYLLLLLSAGDVIEKMVTVLE
ncbi:MAG: right-handed parallel beta-helix repeat-containing protein [Bacteroidota bacterium]|jgi:parallel beta-helix repeat protein